MLQKIILVIAIFIFTLVALTFGESIADGVFLWISHLTGLAIEGFSDIYFAVQNYVLANGVKVLIALLITIPVSIWVIKNQNNDPETSNKQRKVAIILALLLGWIGGHRFYLGQIGWGVFYLLVFLVFPPLAVMLGLIDAVRYTLISDEDFNPKSI